MAQPYSPVCFCWYSNFTKKLQDIFMPQQPILEWSKAIKDGRILAYDLQSACPIHYYC